MVADKDKHVRSILPTSAVGTHRYDAKVESCFPPIEPVLPKALERSRHRSTTWAGVQLRQTVAANG
jgi:hypothetical protein